MAPRGGRRQQSWTVPLSWREATVLETALAIAAARQRPRLSRADWLLALAEPALQQAASASDLPAYLRLRAERALAGLHAERAELAAHPPRLGRPPLRRPPAAPAASVPRPPPRRRAPSRLTALPASTIISHARPASGPPPPTAWGDIALEMCGKRARPPL